MRNAGICVLTSLLAVVAPPGDLRAESKLSASVEHLFELGAKPSAKALHAVQNYYRRLPRSTRDDWRMRYAYAVTLIHQKRLLDARPLLDQASESRPDDLGLWQAAVWVHLTLGDRTKALAEMARFERSMLGPAPDRDGAADQQAAEFCGKIFGFLSGPWHSRLHADDLEKVRSELLDVFEPEEQAVFDQAEKDVLAQYDELRGEHESLSEQAHDEARERFAQARADLLQSQTSLDEKKQNLTDKDAKRSAETKNKLAELDGKLKKLEQQYEKIAAQMVPLELEREALTAQLAAMAAGDAASVQAAIRRNRNFNLAGLDFTYQRPAYNMINRSLAPIVAQLTVLAGKAAEVVDGVAELEAERQTLVFGRVQDAGKIALKKKEIEKQQVRLDRNSKRLKAPKGVGSVKSRAAATRVRLLSAYLEFPFEREKERILQALALE